MKKLLILLPALLLSCTAVSAETICTENANEYISAISMTSAMSIAEDDTDPDTSNCTLLAKFDGELNDSLAIWDIWDEYNIHTLIYPTPEDAEAAYEYYTESQIPVCKNETMYIDAAADYDEPLKTWLPYLSYGPKSIGADKFIQGLIAEYGSTNNMPEITVAVIDSGIDYNHLFLKDRVKPELGYDVHDNDSDPMDEHSHGTHVAGIIADSTPENVSLIPIKATDKNGSLDTEHFKAALQKAIELNPDVINISLASETQDITTSQYDVFYDFFSTLNTQGTSVCVCAGNRNSNTLTVNNADYIFPAYMNDVIVAANHNSNNAINTASSNYGLNADSVIDIAAPGTQIFSTILNNKYNYKSGTSMASPFVATAAALLKTHDPNLSPDEIEKMLKDNAAPYEASNNRYYGTGRLNLNELIYKPQSLISQYEYSDDGRLKLDISNTDGALDDGAVVTIIGSVFGTMTKLTPIEIPPTTEDTVKQDIYFGSENNYGTIKVFLWRSFADPQPLCPVTTIKEKN